MLGVGQTPRSITSHPAASSPARTAERIITPEGRVSRQTRMRPRSRYVPKLSANWTASSGVKVSPTMPRTPVMPIFNGFIDFLKMRLNCTIYARYETENFCRNLRPVALARAGHVSPKPKPCRTPGLSERRKTPDRPCRRSRNGPLGKRRDDEGVRKRTRELRQHHGPVSLVLRDRGVRSC